MFLGETFIIFSNSLDRGRGGRLHIVDQDISSVRVLTKIDGMETFIGGLEFNHPCVSENLEDPTAVCTVTCDSEFLAKLVQGENVRNSLL